MKPNVGGSIERRFWKQVIVGAGPACWEWAGCKMHKGYGRFWEKCRICDNARHRQYLADRRAEAREASKP